jgi:hypothetical protein
MTEVGNRGEMDANGGEMYAFTYVCDADMRREKCRKRQDGHDDERRIGCGGKR